MLPRTHKGLTVSVTGLYWLAHPHGNPEDYTMTTPTPPPGDLLCLCPVCGKEMPVVRGRVKAHTRTSPHRYDREYRCQGNGSPAGPAVEAWVQREEERAPQNERRNAEYLQRVHATFAAAQAQYEEGLARVAKGAQDVATRTAALAEYRKTHPRPEVVK